MLKAGSAVIDITPRSRCFLYGYPHVERWSTGVHDTLTSSAVYLSDGQRGAIFVANDVIFVPKDLAARARTRIEQATGLPGGSVMITATHTHSGPITVNYLSNAADPTVPPADGEFLAQLEDGIVAAAVEAARSAQAAEAGMAVADGRGLGTNRRDPQGPSDPAVPVLAVRATTDHCDTIALMYTVCMHPTVLHEDSTLISADFPGMARAHLQAAAVQRGIVLHHTGPCGNQSPRHVTQGRNTFEEAARLGRILATAVERAVQSIEYTDDFPIACGQAYVQLPPREFPPVADAEAKPAAALARLAELRAADAPATDIRTAQCDWFGAEETLTLARAAADGKLAAARDACMPAEVQVVTVGPWAFVGWPGEVFVEYGLAVKEAAPHACVVSLAGGELQGYLVTPEAVAAGSYEAGNALFAPESGQLLVAATLELLGGLER